MGVRHAGVVTGTGVFELEPIDLDRRTRFTWTEQLRFPWYLGGRLGEHSAVRWVLRVIWRRNLRSLARLVEAVDLTAVQIAARTTAVTAAPSTITTTIGARRHAATTATATPAARASSTRSWPTENVSLTIRAEISAAGISARQRSTHRRQAAGADHHQPEHLEGVGPGRARSRASSSLALSARSFRTAPRPAPPPRRTGSTRRPARTGSSPGRRRRRAGRPAARRGCGSCGATIATNPAGKAASSPHRSGSMLEPTQRPDQRAEVPEGVDTAARSPRTPSPAGDGSVWAVAIAVDSSMHQLGGDQTASERAAAGTRAIVSPYTPLRAASNSDAAQRRRPSSPRRRSR